MATPVHLVTPLPLRDCAERLRAAVSASRYQELTVTGRVTDDYVCLCKLVLRNSFLPYLRGRWQPLPDGTAFRGWVGMHPSVTMFLVVWFGLVGAISAGLWATVLPVWMSGVANPDPHHISNAGAFLLMCPLGMWLFTLLVVWLGRWTSRGTETRLVQFLTEAIQGQQLQPAGTSHQTSHQHDQPRRE